MILPHVKLATWAEARSSSLMHTRQFYVGQYHFGYAGPRFFRRTSTRAFKTVLGRVLSVYPVRTGSVAAAYVCKDQPRPSWVGGQFGGNLELPQTPRPD